MPDEAPKRKDTDFLNLPPSEEITGRSDPMASDAAAVGSMITEFTANSRLQLKIDNTKLIVTVADKELVIGRAVEGDDYNGVDIDLSPQSGYQNGVSRRHAVIRRRGNVLHIEDLKSTNGTRINNSQLTPGREYRLRDGDMVEFGRVRVSVRFIAASGSE